MKNLIFAKPTAIYKRDASCHIPKSAIHRRDTACFAQHKARQIQKMRTMTRFKPYFAQDLFPICSLDRSDAYCLEFAAARNESTNCAHAKAGMMTFILAWYRHLKSEEQ